MAGVILLCSVFFGNAYKYLRNLIHDVDLLMIFGKSVFGECFAAILVRLRRHLLGTYYKLYEIDRIALRESSHSVQAEF